SAEMLLLTLAVNSACLKLFLLPDCVSKSNPRPAMRRPRLNVLRTFEAAGRMRSFSLAAGELNISPAAVSQQMRQLEAHLGEALFQRHHKSVSLTVIGQAYLDGVHNSLERLDTLTDQLFPNRPHQVVTIHCTTSVATLWLAPNVHAFQQAHQDIDLQIRTQETGSNTSPAANADLEIFVSAKTNQESGVVRLFTSVITPVAAPVLCAALAAEIPQDILKFELIHILGYEDDWHSWFQTFNIHSADVPRRLAVDSSLFAIDAALRGDGVFLGRRPFIDTYLNSGELVEVFSQPFHLNANYYLRRASGAKNSSGINRVADWLLVLASQM
ncbi:MAG: LysR family transcriptional regulator, partial [Paracoccaceae bacterium]